MNALMRFGPAGMPAGMDPQEWRRAIEAEVDKLLDRADALVAALDAMEADPDLEDMGDAEPSLGWTGEGRGVQGTSTDIGDDREGETADFEATLGWANEGPQSLLHADNNDSERELEDEHGGDIVDEPHDEEEDADDGLEDAPGFIAGGNEEGERSHSYGHAASARAKFDGSGVAEAKQALRNAGPRIVDEVTRTVGERCHALPSGDILRTAVPYLSGYVRPSGVLPDDDGPEMTDFSAYAPRRGADREDRP